MSAPLALSEVEPLKRDTLGDRAYHQVADLLISGRLAPGDKLSLRTTAEALGVSIMPVREAITRLVADNALEVTPNRAVRVPVMSATRFRDLTRVRIEIEGYAAAEAAVLRNPDDLLRIAEFEEAFSLECGKKRPDHSRAVAFNQALHFAVYEAAQSPTLVDIIRSLWLKAGPVINLDLRANPERLRHSRAKRFHSDLLTAIRAGDAETARAAVANDIQDAATFILSQGRLAD
jgi:DNA-binding GntR family transcriptional regulator